jgi:TPR repeat protein
MRMLGLVLEKAGNLEEAVGWYKASAEKGDKVGMAFLADMYEHGKGTPQNMSEAVRWYKEGAAHGNGLSMARLGACYRDGRGVPQNLAEAKAFAKRAADMGVREGTQLLESLG